MMSGELNFFLWASLVSSPSSLRLGLVPSTTKKIRSYYLDTFGSFNQKFEIANHTFIGLDTPGIVDEDYQRHGKYITFDDWKPIPGGPISFVNEVAECESL
jgi:hypothetical protein